jgi:hypothetical protein
MTTDVDICNRALQQMGTQSTIVSLSELSAEAAACALRYNNLRQRLLRAALWGFAKASGTLTLLRAAPGTPELPSTTAISWSAAFPTPPWQYSYAYPLDCLRFLGVQFPTIYASGSAGIPISPVQTYLQPPAADDEPKIPWEQAVEPDAFGNQQRVIHCDVSQALGVYTRDLLLPDQWDPAFQSAMVAALAAELSIPLSGDKGLYDRNTKAVRDILTEIRVMDANEGQAIDNRMPDALRARGAGMII